MKKRTSILLLTGFICIILGGIMSFSGYFSGAARSLYLSREHGVILPSTEALEPFSKDLDAFSNVKINGGNAEITIREGDTYKVEFQPGKGNRFIADGEDKINYEDSFKVENGTLTVDYAALAPLSQEGVQIFSFNFVPNPNDKITITIPAGTQLESVATNNDSENFSFEGVSVKKAEISTSYGDIWINGGTFENLTVANSSGEVYLGNVTVSDLAKADLAYGSLTVENSKFKLFEINDDSGDINIVNSEIAEKITASNSYGSTTFKNVLAKDVAITAASGDVLLDGTFTGVVDVTDQYGSVEIHNQLAESITTFALETSYGDITVNDMDHGTVFNQGSGSSQCAIKVRNDSGDIDITTGSVTTVPTIHAPSAPAAPSAPSAPAAPEGTAL